MPDISPADFDEYLRQGEPGPRERAGAWQAAIGLQAVDGLRPSACLVEIARRHIEGDITIDEVRQLVASYYRSEEVREQAAPGTVQADKAAANIARLPYPDSPHHPRQKYLLTEQGVQLRGQLVRK